jgi:threonine dehydratase
LKEAGPALVGIELQSRCDYEILISKMIERGVDYKEINKDDTLFSYLI